MAPTKTFEKKTTQQADRENKIGVEVSNIFSDRREKGR
jgi:hypothetical protein